MGTGIDADALDLAIRIAGGFAAICLIASGNHTLNEVLDAPFSPATNSRP